MAQNEMNGLMFKMENDPRITKTGAFLRKTSLMNFRSLSIFKGRYELCGNPSADVG